MVVDSRDQIWAVTFETYYDSYFQELLHEQLTRKWLKLDQFTRVFVALTASGSAVSGWALWADPDFKPIWTCLAGLAALLTIVHATLGVPERLRDYGENKRRWSGLRADIETFRYKMEIDPNFSIESFTAEFSTYRKRYTEIIQLLKDDILSTTGTEEMAQDRLDGILKDQTERRSA
jgi:hypothetical protein